MIIACAMIIGLPAPGGGKANRLRSALFLCTLRAHFDREGFPMRLFVRALAAAALLFTAIAAQAADYPTRNLTLVGPYPPRGGVDAMARIIAQKLGETFHQTFIVDNRGGGGGTIGTRIVAHAKPDGYNLLLGHTGTISINPRLSAPLGMG